MKISKSFKTLVVLGLMLVGLTVTGCASNRSTQLGLRTERHYAGGVQVLSVQLAQLENGLRVSGKVGRLVGYNNSLRRHLDVQVVAPDGTVLSQVATSFSPNPIQRSPRTRSSSSYVATLPKLPPTGSTIRVTVHETRRTDCAN